MSQMESEIVMESSETNSQTLAGTEAGLSNLVNKLVRKIDQLEQSLVDQAKLEAKVKELEQRLSNQAVSATSSETTTMDKPKVRTTSRRKLLKGLGVATAGLAATGAAALSQASNQTAQAASGDFLVLGNSNLAADATYLSQNGDASPSDGAILWADWNPSSKSSAPGTIIKAGLAGTSSQGPGVFGASSGSQGMGVGGYFQGSNAPLLLVPATSGTGAPTTGNHYKGELYIDSAGSFFYCTAGTGTNAGTWVPVGSSGSYVNLQSSSPGTAQTGNMNVTGKVVAGQAIESPSLKLNGVNWTSGSTFPTSSSAGDRYLRTDFRAWFVSDGSVWYQENVPVWSGAFPNYPISNLRVCRSDRGGIEYYYDGARWLSDLIHLPLPARTTQPYTDMMVVWSWPLPRFEIGGVSLEKVYGGFKSPATAQSAVDYWTLSGAMLNNSGGLTTLTFGSQTGIDTNNRTSPFTTPMWRSWTAAITNPIFNTDYFQLEVYFSRTGSPGNFLGGVTVDYRLVG